MLSNYLFFYIFINLYPISGKAADLAPMSSISDNLQWVRERIERASARAGRDPEEITLVAVSKTRTPQEIQEALSFGVQILGENRVQEANEKVTLIQAPVSWHLVGHLQRNKAKTAVSLFGLIHSVDSVRLAKEIGTQASQVGHRANVLVQVNTSGEVSKFGVTPDRVMDLVEQISEIQGLDVCGLMTMGAFTSDPEDVRPSFASLRKARDRIAQAGFRGVSMGHLSMGMTNDFEVAIEEGSTLVRIGTAIFGPRSN